MDPPQSSGLYQFMKNPTLPDTLYTQTRSGIQTMLINDNVDVRLANTTDGPLHFVQTLAQSPWLFDERYLGHVGVGINGRVTISKQTPEWLHMYSNGQSVQTLIALLK